MQHLPLMQVARRVLRAAICPSCYQRQPHDDLLPPSVARPCEAGCALFRHVPVLIGIAADHRADDHPGNAESLMINRICRKSCPRPHAGDYCPEWMGRTCPLARFGAQAVAVLQALPALHVLAERNAPTVSPRSQLTGAPDDASRCRPLHQVNPN